MFILFHSLILIQGMVTSISVICHVHALSHGQFQFFSFAVSIDSEV